MTQRSEVHWAGTVGAALWLSGVPVLPALAVAAAEPEPVIEEIVVTASLRGQSLQSAPASVTVIGEETIRVRHAKHVDQLLNMSPNVNYAAGASRGRFIQIRGVGERSQFKDPLDSSVGLVVDGVDFSGIGLAGVTHDIQQLEVLRGPQGTAFGSNAMGGLVFLKSNEPTESRTGNVSMGVGNYGLWEAGAVVSGALADGLLGRLAVHQLGGDGYMHDDFLGRDDTSDYDELTLRAKLRWQVSPVGRLDITAFHVNADNGYDAFSLENTRHTGSDDPGHDRQRSSALALNFVHDGFEKFSVEATGFYEHSDLEYGFDWDWSNLQRSGIRGWEDNVRDRDGYGVDVRLLSKDAGRIGGVVDWLVGAYYYHRDVDLDYGDSWEEPPFGVFTSSFSSAFESRRAALYGELDWDLTDRLVFSVGGRLERFDDAYSDSAGVRADPNDTLWGGRVALRYRLAEELWLYGAVSRGYKTGGINGQAVAAADPVADPQIADFLQERLAFQAETLVNYEMGARGSFLDGALHLGVSVFFMERNDMQANAWILFPPAEWRSYVDNVDDGENFGLEAEASWRAGERLSLSAGLGLLHTKLGELTIQDIDTGQPVAQKGRDQAHAPDYQYFAAADYAIGENYFVNLQVEGKGRYFFSNSHDVRSEDYVLTHASAGYRGKRLDVSLWGRNLFDRDYQVRGFYFANNPLNGWINEPYFQLGEPRTLGVTVRYGW